MANAVVLNLGCPLRSPGELKYPDVLQTDKSKPLGSGTEASVFFFTQTGRSEFFTSSQKRVTKDKPLGRQSLRGKKGKIWWYTQYCNSSDLYFEVCVFYNSCWKSEYMTIWSGNRSSSILELIIINSNNKGTKQFTYGTQQKTTRLCWGTEHHSGSREQFMVEAS